MDYWNWNFDLEYKSVYHNAWLWTYDSNQWNNDFYEQNVVISYVVAVDVFGLPFDLLTFI